MMHDGGRKDDRARGWRWQRLAPGSLMVKVYLWFLLALTLTGAGVAGVQLLLSLGEFEGRWERHLIDQIRIGRDMTEHLLTETDSPQRLRRLLWPLAIYNRMALIILDDRGQTLLEITPSARFNLSRFHQRLKEVQERPAGEKWFAHTPHGRIDIALPLRLPNGAQGLFYLSLKKRHRRHEGPPYRLLAGLGVVLVLSWILCWPLAARLTRPLQRMSAAAAALGAGAFSTRIRLRRRDEVGRLADSFDAMAENLEQLLASHKQLLADVSHEFRTPLARLRVALELARREAGTDAERYLDTMEKQIGAIDGMIEEVLSYSRLDAGQYPLHWDRLTCRGVLDQVREGELTEARAAGVTLQYEEPLAEAFFYADAKLLNRALVNVLRNAIGHAPWGSMVRLSTAATAERLSFFITDEGAGVPSQLLLRIFEPFVRVGEERSRGTGGVGLAIVRRCMEVHGGGAEAQPGPEGKGLSVTLWLPLHLRLPA